MSDTSSKQDGLEPEITRFFAGLDESGSEPDVDRAIYALGKRIDAKVAPVAPRYVQRRKWIVSAAGAVLIILISAGIYQISRPTQCFPPRPSTYSTMIGQTATIHLDDNSKIILGPTSKIQVSGRRVELQGEAVFTVTKHTQDPFTVQAGNTVTRVLGTTFGIRAYDSSVRVAVQDGKISVDSSRVLGSGDVATVTDKGTSVRHNVDVSQMLNWTSGRLEYRSALLSDIIPDLSRWYGVEIRLADSTLANQHFTGTLKPGSIAELANILELTYKVRVVRVGNILILETSPGR